MRIYPKGITKYHGSNQFQVQMNRTQNSAATFKFKNYCVYGEKKLNERIFSCCTDLEWEFSNDGSKNPAIHDLYLSLTLLNAPGKLSNSPAAGPGES